jgi:four helix bundle protein
VEERTFLFAQRNRNFIKLLPKTISNIEDIKQLIRSSGSVAANYIETNESFSKKDFVFRIKICRKEATDINEEKNLEPERLKLVEEASELYILNIVSRCGFRYSSL